MAFHQTDWRVLLIGGPSGVGKTIVAQQLGLRFGVSWLQVDDVRLALQRSQVTLPEETEALYFFTGTPDIWNLPAERLRADLIAVGRVMSPALEVIIENHVDTNAPIIIEGDGILPSLLARPPVRERAEHGYVQGLFLIEPEEEAFFANIVMRNRGIAEQSEAEVRAEAHVKWLYGQWLAHEARRYNVPVVEPRPWPTLNERVMAAIGAK